MISGLRSRVKKAEASMSKISSIQDIENQADRLCEKYDNDDLIPCAISIGKDGINNILYDVKEIQQAEKDGREVDENYQALTPVVYIPLIILKRENLLWPCGFGMASEIQFQQILKKEGLED
jgi:hypothetical protein